jgi:hypothetical protein
MRVTDQRSRKRHDVRATAYHQADAAGVDVPLTTHWGTAPQYLVPKRCSKESILSEEGDARLVFPKDNTFQHAVVA